MDISQLFKEDVEFCPDFVLRVTGARCQKVNPESRSVRSLDTTAPKNHEPNCTHVYYHSTYKFLRFVQYKLPRVPCIAVRRYSCVWKGEKEAQRSF